MFFLKTQPFAVEAHFKSSLVLTYAVPKEELKQLIPECLEPDTLNNEWAFIAVAMVQAQKLRPKGFPEIMGNDFFLTGFRAFVKYTNNAGKNLRGLYILKSETDKKTMTFLGNIFTHYNYSTTDILLSEDHEKIAVFSAGSDLDIEVLINRPDALLPARSPFKDWKEARRYAGPLPFTFTFSPETREVLIIEGVRENWVPAPVEVLKDKIGFIGLLNFKNIVLANAFIIQNIPYYWKKGKIEIWKG